MVVDNPGGWDHGKAGTVQWITAAAPRPVAYSVHLDSEPMGTSRYYPGRMLKPEQATAPKGVG